MPKEPDNVVLKLLREIRSTQDDHAGKLDKMPSRLDELHESMTYALGLSAHANVRHEAVQKKIDELEKRIKKLEARA